MQQSTAPLCEVLADPCLEKVHAGTCKGGATVHVLRGNIVAAGPALRALHARMHPLVRFYIDGASALEQDDPRMDLLLAVKMEGSAPVAVLGLLTFYTCAHDVPGACCSVVVPIACCSVAEVALGARLLLRQLTLVVRGLVLLVGACVRWLKY